MKCRNCDCLKWYEICDFLESKRMIPYCIGVKEPFRINNIDNECTEYPEKQKQNIGCKYCKGIDIMSGTFRGHGDDIGVKVDTERVFGYCPLCGRKL